MPWFFLLNSLLSLKGILHIPILDCFGLLNYISYLTYFDAPQWRSLRCEEDAPQRRKLRTEKNTLKPWSTRLCEAGKVEKIAYLINQAEAISKSQKNLTCS